MRARFTLFAAFAASSTIAAAFVPADGTDTKEEVRIRKIMHSYAKCVVGQKHDLATKAILSNVGTDAISKTYPGLMIGDCLPPGTEMRFGLDLYRYALADALVNADFAISGETDFSNRLPLAHLPFPDRSAFDQELAKVKSKRKQEELKTQFSKANGVAWLSRFGECIVRAEPKKSRYWLLTPPDVPEETSRINDLRTAFNGCIGTGTVKFNRITLRGTVAINYFRLARATAVGKTS